MQPKQAESSAEATNALGLPSQLLAATQSLEISAKESWGEWTPSETQKEAGMHNLCKSCNSQDLTLSKSTPDHSAGKWTPKGYVFSQALTGMNERMVLSSKVHAQGPGIREKRRSCCGLCSLVNKKLSGQLQEVRWKSQTEWWEEGERSQGS